MDEGARAGTKRPFSFHLTTCLHRRLKVAATMEETSMSDLLQQILEDRLPSPPVWRQPKHQDPRCDPNPRKETPDEP
jgi:hypothetical protein